MKPDKHIVLGPGTLLVAEAGMLDPNFGRTVVFLCAHEPSGSFGLVLNQAIDVQVSQLIDTFGWDSVVYRGGPVELNSLHILHARGDLDLGSIEILPGVCWGGDFRKLNEALAEGVMNPSECRFFIGYSGWANGQLLGEVQQDAWYLAKGSKDMVFRDDNVNYWRETLKKMGPDYKLYSMFPDDPQLN